MLRASQHVTRYHVTNIDRPSNIMVKFSEKYFADGNFVDDAAAPDVGNLKRSTVSGMESTVEATDDWLEDCLDTVGVPGTVHGVLTASQQHKLSTLSRMSKDDRKVSGSTKQGSRPHSTPLTLKWLEENYEIAEGVCIPRSTLYVHYQDYCTITDTQAVNAASFGKIIRQQFPQITTRRLGTRGQSKYHYYGIGVKETSKYYELIYSKKGIQSVSECKREVVKQMVSYSPRCKIGALLPEFPSVSDIKLTADISVEKVTTFMVMYRTHCQRILDTVVRANFDEVQSFLIHFWQGMPSHIIPIFTAPVVATLIGVCDSILYQTIATVLIPSILQPLPDSLTQLIHRFARQLEVWLKAALEDVPLILQGAKFEQARIFSKALMRLSSLNSLSQAARGVVQSSDITSQMLTDWSRVDLNGICKQILYTVDKYTEHDYNMIVTLCREFEELLHEKAPLEAYTDWLDSMINRCTVQPCAKRPERTRHVQQQFLLTWSHFATRIIRDMTLHSAASFGSFHLLHLMFHEYVLYMIEALQSQERYNELLKVLNGQEVYASVQCDVTLPYSTNASSVTSSAAASVDIKPTYTQLIQRRERQSVITDTREAMAAAADSYMPKSNQRHQQETSPSVTSYDSRDGVPGQQVSPLVASHVTNSFTPSTSDRNSQTTQSFTDSNAYATDPPYDHYKHYGYRPREYYYVTPDWTEYQQRCGSFNMTTSAYSIPLSDYDAAPFTGSATGVVAYAGSHGTKQYTPATDPVTYVDTDSHGKRRATYSNAGYQLSTTAAGVAVSCKKQRFNASHTEFGSGGSSFGIAEGFSSAAVANYGQSFG